MSSSPVIYRAGKNSGDIVALSFADFRAELLAAGESFLLIDLSFKHMSLGYSFDVFLDEFSEKVCYTVES